MKLCINSGCKHALDDYQERCPFCGWSQKSFKIDKSDEKGMQIYQILHLISAPIFLTKHLFRIKREMPLYQYGYISRLLLMY